MFDCTTDYPRAVASADEAGLDDAIEWCVSKAEDDDTIYVWTSLVSNLSNSPQSWSSLCAATATSSASPAAALGTHPALVRSFTAWPDKAGTVNCYGSHPESAPCES